MLEGYWEAAKNCGKQFAAGRENSRGQLGLGTLTAAFIVVLTAFVILIVVDQFQASTGTVESSQLSTAQGDILSGFASMMSLLEPLLLIAIGVVIIGLVQRLRN